MRLMRLTRSGQINFDVPNEQQNKGHVVQLLSTKIVHFYDKSMKLCQITTNPKTNISGYGAKPNSTLDTSTAQALKWPT